MRTNSIGPNFGSAVTVNKIYLVGELVYTRYRQRAVGDNKVEDVVKAVMKSLRENLKGQVDTPVAKKMNEIVPDLYYKFGKKTSALYLPDSCKEVNLLTGAHAFTLENIYNNKGLNRRQKGYYIQQAISEMFDRTKETFAGFIDIKASTRDMVEKEGKKPHELIAIDDITVA